MEVSAPGFQIRDGLKLHLNNWPVAQPRARMLIVHGLGEHSGRYAALASELNAQGISVRAFDHRGHGRSPGKCGTLNKDPDCLSHDVVEIFNGAAWAWWANPARANLPWRAP